MRKVIIIILGFTNYISSMQPASPGEPAFSSESEACRLLEDGYYKELAAQGEPDDFVEVQKEGMPAQDIGSLLKSYADSAAFFALRKTLSRRSLIKTIYELGYKKNVEGTIASLSMRKEYNGNYYLDVAVSEARVHNDHEFVMDILPLIKQALSEESIFSKQNSFWLITVLQNNNKECSIQISREIQKIEDRITTNKKLCELLKKNLPQDVAKAQDSNY